MRPAHFFNFENMLLPDISVCWQRLREAREVSGAGRLEMVPMTVSSYTITQDRVNETKGPGQYQNGTLQAYAAMSHGVL